MLSDSTRIVVLGLGYVGLPLAVALAKRFDTFGVDIDVSRIEELRAAHDRTGEVDRETLSASLLKVSEEPADAPPADFYIVTVPTPITPDNRPDLTLVEAASRTVARLLPGARADGREPIVIYESTVYPGVTESICAPLLEDGSGLECGRDFFLGYSPERINPGDREHTIDKITKVVSGQTPETLARVSALYGTITSAGVFEASSIKAAEAAKVIENAQRDINIAFMNEITQIFSKMDLSIWDVLAAARTKWNFLPFTPGLVGGHCIGVDPYYLSHRALELGLEPRVILAGRSVNDGMAAWLAGKILEDSGKSTVNSQILVLGITFKENVPDLRNSKVVDLISALEGGGHRVTVHDPMADPIAALHEYGIALEEGLPSGPFDIVILAVAHRDYLALAPDSLRKLVAKDGILADLKGVLGSAADWIL